MFSVYQFITRINSHFELNIKYIICRLNRILAGESVDGYFNKISSIPGLVQTVGRRLPSPSIEYLDVLQVLVLLPSEAPSGHAAHHRQLTVDGGHSVASPGTV